MNEPQQYELDLQLPAPPPPPVTAEEDEEWAARLRAEDLRELRRG